VWGIVSRDEAGQATLLLGGQPSKYREDFEVRFRLLGDSLSRAFQAPEAAPAAAGRGAGADRP